MNTETWWNCLNTMWPLKHWQCISLQNAVRYNITCKIFDRYVCVLLSICIYSLAHICMHLCAFAFPQHRWCIHKCNYAKPMCEYHTYIYEYVCVYNRVNLSEVSWHAPVSLCHSLSLSTLSLPHSASVATPLVTPLGSLSSWNPIRQGLLPSGSGTDSPFINTAVSHQTHTHTRAYIRLFIV